MTPLLRYEPARVLSWAVLILGLAFAVPPTLKAAQGFVPAANKDYSLWYEMGWTVRSDGPLYTISTKTYEVRYMYPPAPAIFAFAPLSALGYTGFVFALGVLNAAAWAWCVRYSPRLAAGPDETPGWLAAGLPTLIAGVYVWDMFHLGQPNLVLLAFVLAAAAALRHARPGLAGVCLGLAVTVKAFPLPILCYFIARRSWTAVAATVATVAVVLIVLPAPIRGWERNLAELDQWQGIMFGDQSGDTMSARSSIGYGRRNQSLLAVSHRLLRPVEAGLDAAGKGFTVNFANVSAKTAQNVGFGAGVVLGLVLVVSTRGRFGVSREAEGLEWGMVIVLAVLCSPLGWTYFYCWMLPPWAAAVRYCLRYRSRWAVVGCTVAGLFFLAAMTEQFDERYQAYGVTCWGGVALFLTLAGMRWAVGAAVSRRISEPVLADAPPKAASRTTRSLRSRTAMPRL